jgi:hypothetical protein
VERLGLLAAAIVLVILGARGTYKAVWNSFFPNEPITTTPVSTLPSLSGVASSVAPSTSNSTGGQPGQTATNPVQVGQQAASASKSWISSLLGNSGGSNTMAPGTSGNASNVPSVNVPSGKQAVVSTGSPSWWPSWLPYPSGILGFPGGGFTGQYRNVP